MARLNGQLKTPRKPLGSVFEFDRCMLYGMPKICVYMGCTDTTLRSWIRKHGFPASKMPNGSWASSTALIDLWILSRNPYLSKTFV